MRTELFIDGGWLATANSFPVTNPATEEVVHHIPAASAADADAAVKAAREAFDHGPWPRMTGAERAMYLRAMAQGIKDRLPELARLEVIDNGKPLPEAEWDLADAAGCFDFYADLAEGLDGEVEEIALADARFTSKAVREPIGVCVGVIPWNYPLLIHPPFRSGKCPSSHHRCRRLAWWAIRRMSRRYHRREHSGWCGKRCHEGSAGERPSRRHPCRVLRAL